jgi:hypothetical protein
MDRGDVARAEPDLWQLNQAAVVNGNASRHASAFETH